MSAGRGAFFNTVYNFHCKILKESGHFTETPQSTMSGFGSAAFRNIMYNSNVYFMEGHFNKICSSSFIGLSSWKILWNRTFVEIRLAFIQPTVGLHQVVG